MSGLVLWCAAFALMLQLIGGPSLALRQRARAADPLRAAQLLCEPGASQHQTPRHPPAPDARQWALLHGWAGMLAQAGGVVLPLPAWRRIASAGIDTSAARLAGLAALYRARAPPV